MMEESVFVPSPNWFLPSGLSVSKDGWLVYGGPSKSLCVLEPLQGDGGPIDGDQRFKAHVSPKAHLERILCVDIHPDWPARRNFITGSADGAVKEWYIEETENKYYYRSIHSHESHTNEKEEVVGVGYSTESIIITVGSFAYIVKWDLSSNVVRPYHLIKNFRPTAVSCSPHIPMQVAIGTKQGVIFLVDVSGNGKILYKVRGQDDEVLKLSWCPQYEVTMQRGLEESAKRRAGHFGDRRKSQDENMKWRTKDINTPKSSAMQRLERIRNEPEPTMEPLNIPGLTPREQITAAESTLKKPDSENTDIENTSNIDASGVDKTLPDDSFDDTVEVIEDDMFDIYKDHEADEFGHKKFEPIDMYVTVKSEEKETDFLAECLKLKADILKNKDETQQSITDLVEKMEKTHVDDKSDVVSEAGTSMSESVSSMFKEEPVTTHIHKHLLASIGKYCGIRIWSKSGKLVATCAVPSGNTKQYNNKVKSSNWPSLHWYKANSLLIADGKNQVLDCNPLVIDRKNKLEWTVIHSLHRRGLYCIVSDAPKVQTPELFKDEHIDDNWSIWTAGQDRNIIRYNMKKRTVLAKHLTCGGFLYNIKPCPYDASKLAMGVGDGAVRVWESGTTEDDAKLLPGTVTMYWQNVQGKVLTVAWHPTKENLLAFSTGESRVGLIDTSSKTEKPAKTLLPALNCGVYSMAWGTGMDLYACGGGNLVVYQANKPDQSPITIPVVIEGQKWEITSAVWNSYGLLVGSNGGGIALMKDRRGDVIAVYFAYTKMVHTMDWHPQQTSNSSEESKYKNIISVLSFDKTNAIEILQFRDKEGGGKEFAPFTKLSGHKSTVLQQAWNPHRDGQLVTTSHDYTARVWDISTSACIATFGGHVAYTLGVTWCPQPSLADCVLSGAADCTLRVWRVQDFPPDNYQEKKHMSIVEPYKKKKANKSKDKKDTEESSTVATSFDARARVSKKFLFPITYKQMHNHLDVVRRILCDHVKKYKEFRGLMEVLKENPDEYNTDYLKLFGGINDVNEVIEKETAFHLEFHNFEAYVMLLIFRGRIDDMIQFVSEKDLLDPYLLSITPCVSFKYWKEATQLYVAQIDRLVAKGEEEKLQDSRFYGGAAYRKAATLLSIHDVKGAIDVLMGGHLYKEAYILCRIRHMDSIAEQILSKWAYYCCAHVGNFLMGAIIYLVLGDLSTAAASLGKSCEQENLNLAAELAKVAGHNSLADHIEKKANNKEKLPETTEEILEELPKRMEILLQDALKDEDSESKACENGVNGKCDDLTNDNVDKGVNCEENGEHVNGECI